MSDQPPPPGAPPPPPGGQDPWAGQPAPPPQGWQGQAPPPQGWQGQASPPQGWQGQPPQQIVIKQGPGCLKIGLIVLGILVLLGVLAGGCVALTANEVGKELDRSMGEASADDYDITVTSCEIDDILGPQAKGEITNTSDKSQGFEIEVRFESPDGDLISDDPTFTDTLEPGQSTAWTITSLESGVTEVECAAPEVSYTIFDDEEGN